VTYDCAQCAEKYSKWTCLSHPTIQLTR
jgi:hypothetical protein